MRAVILVIDGVDEAAGLRQEIEAFVHKELVPSGVRVLVTSRPEGVKTADYRSRFVIMNLCELTNDQQVRRDHGLHRISARCTYDGAHFSLQRRVINVQMQGSEFFDHLLSLGEVQSRPHFTYGLGEVYL